MTRALLTAALLALAGPAWADEQARWMLVAQFFNPNDPGATTADGNHWSGPYAAERDCENQAGVWMRIAKANNHTINHMFCIPYLHSEVKEFHFNVDGNWEGQ